MPPGVVNSPFSQLWTCKNGLSWKEVDEDKTVCRPYSGNTELGLHLACIWRFTKIIKAHCRIQQKRRSPPSINAFEISRGSSWRPRKNVFRTSCTKRIQVRLFEAKPWYENCASANKSLCQVSRRLLAALFFWSQIKRWDNDDLFDCKDHKRQHSVSPI